MNPAASIVIPADTRWLRESMHGDAIKKQEK